MANYNCSACNDLREDAPNLIVNGLGETECTSLKNNTGLNPSNANDDCTDLENLNDCLVGNMEQEIDAYDVCEWKEFMKQFIPNVWTVFKGIICSMCGLWTRVENLCRQLKRASFIGIMTLYTDSATNESTGSGDDVKTVALPFEKNSIVGNAPSGLFSVKSDNKGIIVKNITDVPLIVDATYNCSVRTSQHIASCYLTVTRDGKAIGQTPFITPDTYDQQAMAEPFVLQPGETTTLGYYFGVGWANHWYNTKFGTISDQTNVYVHAKHERRTSSDPENQRSYFNVKVTSVLPEASC